jgi:serine/threonine protein phosphatase PrpC
MSPLPGELESGDRYLVTTTKRGALVAVVDGLGHGTEAAKAAGTAIDTLEAHANESLARLVQLCDQKMQATRGAAVTLALFDGLQNTLTWLSIGNVDGILLRRAAGSPHPDESILMRGGVVGFRLPLLQPMVAAVGPGDTLILATDGIRHGFSERVSRIDPPQQLADHICADYSKDNDDALVLVARYRGVRP